MAKWADYGISKVHYENDPKRIGKVKRMADNGDGLGPEEERSRQQVIGDLKTGRTYVTINRRSDGSYSKGANIEIVKHSDGEEFIRTDRDATDRDNLGELEKF